MITQVPLGLTAWVHFNARAKKAAHSEGEGNEATAAGIQGTASFMSEVADPPLGLGLCCPGTSLSESSLLG